MSANPFDKFRSPGQHFGSQAKAPRGFDRSLRQTAALALVAACLIAHAAVAQVYDVLKAFNHADGAGPSAALIQGADGNLYGTTTYGGASAACTGGLGGCGTIFKIDLASKTLTTLHSFVNTDGANPTGRLIQGTDGNLYGTTALGGANGAGTIFKIGTDGAGFATLHSFVSTEGAYPYTGVIQGADGNLYGTTYEGGAHTAGTIFKIHTNGSAFTVLHSFNYSDGAFPYANLLQGADGNLYGTTVLGGSNGAGTIFKIDTNGSTLTTLHHFVTSDGAQPYAGLIQGADGNLYGTTVFGGANGVGTIFKIHTNGTTLTTLHSFVRSDGSDPYAGLIQGADGNLYGTTTYGGAGSCVAGCGTVFKFDISGSTLVTLHSLIDSGGSYPTAGLLQATDGNFYGTASAGGSGGAGVVFGIVHSCFNDVLPSGPFSTFICTIAQKGIAAGCGGGNYCPDNPVTRAQMAVFLLRAEHGSSYTPPACTPPGTFADVPCPGSFAVDWIEQLSAEAVTGGCGGGNYCPDNPVTRADMAVLLLRTEHGSSYTPPACTPPGTFGDVPCPGGFAVDWIEQLSVEGVTGGCGGGNYCPDDPNTRGQMAVFLVKAFGL